MTLLGEDEKEKEREKERERERAEGRRGDYCVRLAIGDWGLGLGLGGKGLVASRGRREEERDARVACSFWSKNGIKA